MVRSTNDNTPSTQSPNRPITQETKARFNELLNAALSNEVVKTEPRVLKAPRDSNPKEHSDGKPKAFPRQRQLFKSPESLSHLTKKYDSTKVYSSEESSGNRKTNKQVIAEVHSSQSRLVPSSSDDDILAEKKEKKKRKKTRWKQITESVPVTKGEGEDNLAFQMNVDDETAGRSSSRLSARSYVVESPTFSIESIKQITEKTTRQQSLTEKKVPSRSPSRLSNRSYVLETPTFPAEEIRLITRQKQIQQSNSADKNLGSPSHTSDDSYIIEIPTVLVESVKTDRPPVLTPTKPPVPLPRRKSLKPVHKFEEDEMKDVAKEERHVVEDVIQKERTDTVITIHDSTPQGTEDDMDTSKSAAVNLREPGYPYTDDGGDFPLVKKQKRRKKRRKMSRSREEIEMKDYSTKVYDQTISKNENLEEKITQLILNERVQQELASSSGDDQIVGVTIHGMDRPLVDLLVRHPVVKIFIVDTSTGELFTKSDPKRCVCYFEENTSYVQPIMTHLFDFKTHRSVIPCWEECLLLNESFSHLITETTLLLFEVCDFLTAPVASSRHAKLGTEAAWHKVAWAFLRPISSNGTLNVNSKLRLQLYKPGKQPKGLSQLTPAVYEWWGSALRQKYSGCLYVTVSAVDPPSTPLSPRLRSRASLQGERASMASVQTASMAGSEANSEDNSKEKQPEERPDAVVWTRLSVQSCKMPNARLTSLPVDGSMSLRFSPDGLWLACGKQEILVFSVPQFLHTATLTEHQGLVYSLRWSSDSKVLLSASADSTVCVWRPKSRKNPLLQMLAHPSFVYCAEWLSTPGYCTVVTGCYDYAVRVWKGDTHSTYQLVQELTGHSSYVTGICVSVDSFKVISADSHGHLRVYEVEDGSLNSGRELRVRELRGVAVSGLAAHPGGHRLLVHSRDSAVRSVDLATGAVMQTFKGHNNRRLQTGMCLSACGSLVFACGEDGAVFAWDSMTGALRGVYCGLLSEGSAAVHYHPYEHMMAVGSLSGPPVHALVFQQHATGEEIGLTAVKIGITAADVIEKMKTMQSSNKWQKAMHKIITKAPTHGNLLPREKKKKGIEKHEEEENEKMSISSKWPSLPQLQIQTERSSGDSKDLRLLEIIQKMDNILLAAKQSSQSP